VDFFLAHQASAAALPSEEVIDLLEDLRRSGKIVEFGVATEFDWLLPVLSERPRLSQVVQFDSDLLNRHVAALAGTPGRLLITYGFINRTIIAIRDKLQHAPGFAAELGRADDDVLGGLVLRAAVLANPTGMTLMQSRSAARIERNVRAAGTAQNDDRIQLLSSLLDPPC
jgi:hypothetical protein